MDRLSKPPAKPPHVTKADIELYHALGEEARQGERRASSARKRQREVADKLMLFVEAKRPAGTRSVERSGYRLSIVSVAKSVAWAKEFAKAVSEAAAEKLRKNAGLRDKLTVEKL